MVRCFVIISNIIKSFKIPFQWNEYYTYDFVGRKIMIFIRIFLNYKI